MSTQLTPEEFRAQLPKNSKERIEAVRALAHNNANADTLILLIQKERPEVKSVAREVLATVHLSPATVAYWGKRLSQKEKVADNPKWCEQVMICSANEEFSELIAQACIDRFQTLIEKKGKIDDIELGYLSALLRMAIGKISPLMIQFYELLAQSQNALQSFNSLRFDLYSNSTSPITAKKLFNFMLCSSLVFNPQAELIQLVQSLYKTHGSITVGGALTAALLAQPSAQVYDEFGMYIMPTMPATAQYNTPEYAVFLAVLDVLGLLSYDRDEKRYVFSIYLKTHYSSPESYNAKQPLNEALDPRWIKALTTTADKIKPSYITHSPYYAGTVIGDYDHVIGDLLPYDNAELCQQVLPYFLKRAEYDSGTGATYLEVLYRLGHHDMAEVLFKKWGQKANATSIYDLHSDLLYRTHYSPQKRLEVYEEALHKVKRKELKISSATTALIQEGREKLAK